MAENDIFKQILKKTQAEEYKCQNGAKMSIPPCAQGPPGQLSGLLQAGGGGRGQAGVRGQTGG